MDDGIAAGAGTSSMAERRWRAGGYVQGAANAMSLGLLGLLRTRTVWSDRFVAAVLVDA